MRLPATEKGLFAVNMFIAELHGIKGLSAEDKAAKGYEFYEERKLLELDLTKEKDRSELHENIWLERLYSEVEQYEANKIMRAIDETVEPFEWSVPIELDFSASMLGIMGLLLGDKRLLEMTNMSYTGIMNDPWQQGDMKRSTFKAPAMRMLYGSAQTAEAIWKAEKIKFTPADSIEFMNILDKGAFGLANDVKNFIIQYCKPTATMYPTVWGVTYQVGCNKWKQQGDYATQYDIFDTETGKVRRVTHVKTKKVPDLDQFRRYWITNLIHHLDSRIADTVCEKIYDKYNWVIDIHDAFLVNPEAAEDVRTWAAEELDKIYADRKTILVEYFNSINIGAEAVQAWKDIMSRVVPVENFKASGWTLK